MAQIRKPDPEKYCEYCGERLKRKTINGRLEDLGVFKRRKYCDQKCMGLGHRKETPTISALWKRANRFIKDKCDMCGTTENLDTHHKDLNPKNNEPENLMTLCDSCHTKWHWQHGKKMCKVSRYFGLQDTERNNTATSRQE